MSERLDGMTLEEARARRAELDLERGIELNLAAKDVGPSARKKLAPVIRKFMRSAHPHRACMRACAKHGFFEDCAAGCATLKDIGTGTTKWRGRGGGKKHGVDMSLSDEGTVVPFLADDGGLDALSAMSDAELATFEAELDLADAYSTPALGPTGMTNARERQPEEPPNLRDSGEDEGGTRERCSTCEHFDGGTMCTLYRYGVRPEQVCDSWSSSAEHGGHLRIGN